MLKYNYYTSALTLKIRVFGFEWPVWKWLPLEKQNPRNISPLIVLITKFLILIGHPRAYSNWCAVTWVSNCSYSITTF